MTNILALLMAIAVVESNNQDHKIGQAGEVSRFQIMPHVFKVHGLPYNIKLSDSSNPQKAYKVAQSITKSHIELLHRESVPITAENLYLAWNLGFYRFKSLNFDKRRINRRSLADAARVQTLYDENVKSLR